MFLYGKEMYILKRNTRTLSDKEFDLVIIGGGIFGVCAAWDAALRGLTVALIEKDDFCHATSANHFKMVHGGIRYLQHADIARIRESCRERSAFLRIAPHLVYPLPIVIPTYGLGVKGKPFLGTGMLAYDLITLDRNKGLKNGRKIPRTRFVSRKTVLELFPGLKASGLTGAAIFCDGQMHNPPRLAMSFLRAAIEKGAVAANYVRAEGFLLKNGAVGGVKARDVITGDEFDVRAKVTINAGGPWAHDILKSQLGITMKPIPTFSRDLAFVVKRRIDGQFALAVSTGVKDADSIVDRGGRHLFVVPWRDYNLIGVWHVVFKGLPEQIKVNIKELEAFVCEVNRAYPGMGLRVSDILTVNTGLTLYGEESRQGKSKMSFGKRSILVDHFSADKIQGLLTLIGVRATTARGMAEKTIDIVLKKIGRTFVPSITEETPIYGGGIESFPEFLSAAAARRPFELTEEQITALVHNYGTQYPNILNYIEEQPELKAPLGNSTVLRAEVVHALREEAAQKLSDVVFRRTDLATAEIPSKQILNECAQVMAEELGWNRDRLHQEVESIRAPFHIYDH
jgi:glycerol-3-phosphate dehydrogenase